MITSNSLDIVKEAYAAFGRGDLPGLMSHVAPDCEWECDGPAQIPWAGSFRGHAGVERFFAALGAECEILAFEPRTFVADGDTVVVLGSEKLRSRRTARTCENRWAHAFTVKNGKIVAFREYTDTAAIVAAFGG